MTQIADNVASVRETIEMACQRVGRDPSTVTLVAVSKQKPAADMIAAAAAGVQHFGENRVEEAQTKIPQVRDGCSYALRWHMIGHIQTRKAKHVANWFDVIHSIDRVKIAERVSRQAAQMNELVDVLVQVNVSGEESKGGLWAYNWEKDEETFARLKADCHAIAQLPGLRVSGLMTMAPFVADHEQVRPVFASTFALRARLQRALGLTLPHLSMGMTGDYPVAIEEGATMVRIGRAIFGERQY